MLDRISFTRQVVILKGIDTKNDLIPNGYIKLQKIGAVLEFDMVLQSIFVDEEKLNFYAIVKQTSYLPIYLTLLPKPKKGKLEHYLSTNCSNVFNSGISFNEIAGFLIAKVKKDKIECLLIGELEGNNLFNIEKDIISYFNKSNKANNDEKKIGFKVEGIKEDNVNKVNFEKDDTQDEIGNNDLEIIKKDYTQIKENIAEKDDETIQKEDKNTLDVDNQSEKEIIEVINSEKVDILDEIENQEKIENQETIEDQEEIEYRFNVLEFGNKGVWKRIFDELKEIGEKYKPFSDDKVKWVKIDKKDVYKVSQYHPFLYILSSPFVLKLIGNYGYIIIGLKASKRSEKVEILLPGEYSEEDQKNARVFGFSEFITKDNKIYEGKDGYWRMSIELIQGEV